MSDDRLAYWFRIYLDIVVVGGALTLIALRLLGL